MIYAVVDVELADHEKAIRAGSAMYLWTWGQLWLRKHRSSDGRIPKAVALKCPWESTAANARALARLIQANLWLPDAGDAVVVWNYAKKNDTRDVIEARIEAARARQEAYRARKKAPRGEPSTREEQGDQGNPSTEREVTGNGSLDAQSPAAGVAPSAAPAEATDRRVKRDDPMPEDCAAVLATLEQNEFGSVSLRDVPAVWRKFCGHYDGALWLSQRAGKWQKWLITTRDEQRKEDRLARERAERFGSATAQPTSPARRLFQAGRPV